jgi:FkbM family methyltransferase
MSLPSCLALDRDGFECACRAACQSVYLGGRTLLCRVLTQWLLFADSTDVGFTPHICLDGFWESWVSLALARWLPGAAYCLDVGANHGYYSLLLGSAARAAGGRLLCCEPNPRPVALLHKTLEVNGLGRHAEVIPMAVSDRAGQTATLCVPGGRALNGTICRTPGPGDEAVLVTTTSIDELTAGWPRVDLIKIDAEGSEERIWRGMRQTLGRCPGVGIVMEVNPGRYPDPAGFFLQIEAAGFPLQAVGFDSRVRPVSAAEILANGAEDAMLFLRRS